MNNQMIMAKIMELGTQQTLTREQGIRTAVQRDIIKAAFGVKDEELERPAEEFERDMVLSEKDIREKFAEYHEHWEWTKQQQDVDKEKEYQHKIDYFIDGVAFFHKTLAEELRIKFLVSLLKKPLT